MATSRGDRWGNAYTNTSTITYNPIEYASFLKKTPATSMPQKETSVYVDGLEKIFPGVRHELLPNGREGWLIVFWAGKGKFNIVVRPDFSGELFDVHAGRVSPFANCDEMEGKLKAFVQASLSALDYE